MHRFAATIVLCHRIALGPSGDAAGDAVISAEVVASSPYIGRTSVFVTHDEAGAARGFVNVCRHRGYLVAEDASG